MAFLFTTSKHENIHEIRMGQILCLLNVPSRHMPIRLSLFHFSLRSTPSSPSPKVTEHGKRKAESGERRAESGKRKAGNTPRPSRLPRRGGCFSQHGVQCTVTQGGCSAQRFTGIERRHCPQYRQTPQRLLRSMYLRTYVPIYLYIMLLLGLSVYTRAAHNEDSMTRNFVYSIYICIVNPMILIIYFTKESGLRRLIDLLKCLSVLPKFFPFHPTDLRSKEEGEPPPPNNLQVTENSSTPKQSPLNSFVNRH